MAERFAATHPVLRVSRHAPGTPATGSHSPHAQDQEASLDAAPPRSTILTGFVKR